MSPEEIAALFPLEVIEAALEMSEREERERASNDHTTS